MKNKTPPIPNTLTDVGKAVVMSACRWWSRKMRSVHRESVACFEASGGYEKASRLSQLRYHHSHQQAELAKDILREVRKDDPEEITFLANGIYDQVSFSLTCGSSTDDDHREEAARKIVDLIVLETEKYPVYGLTYEKRSFVDFVISKITDPLALNTLTPTRWWQNAPAAVPVGEGQSKGMSLLVASPAGGRS